MISSYFKIAWRNITKNKFHSLINMTGLALGMAGAVLLLLNIQYGLSVDQFHEKKDHIYQVYNKGIIDGNLLCWNQTSAPLGPALKKDYPEIKNTARLMGSDKLFRYADKKIQAEGKVIDPAFLTMFSFPLAEGNAQMVFNNPNAIVITAELARKIFGSEDPINKIITTPTGDNFIVTGVLKDLPDNTQFKFDYLLPWEYLRAKGIENATWTNQNTNTFVELMPAAQVGAVNKKIAGVVAANSPIMADVKVFLYPLSKLYLEGRFENGKPSGGNIDNLRMLGILAGIILLIACINFMNLSTARSEKRAKEVGIRKVVGAYRRSLIFQFIGESVLMAFFAGITALVLVQMALPEFSTLAHAHLSVPWESPYFWVAALGFVLFTGLLAGSYPAFYLSSFKPVRVLKGVLKNANALVTPRRVLVVLQFVFSIFLINFIIIFQKQIRYGLSRETGFVKENLIFHPLTDDLRKNYAALKNELINTGTAVSVCESNSPVTRISGEEGGLKWEGMDPKANPSFVLLMESGGFIRTNGLTLAAGRDIDLERYPGDTTSCLVNERSGKVLGFKDPIGHIIKDDDVNWKIVGVVKDFLIGEPDQAVDPVLIKGSTGGNFISIRLRGGPSSFQDVQQAEAILKKYNPAFLTEYQFADEDYAAKFQQAKNAAVLIGTFAFLAIFISCMGLLGLSTYMAENRTKEIGIRKVLGASIGSITTLLARDFVRLILVSILIASPLAWFFMHSFLQKFSYRTSLSAWILVAAGGAALLISLITISTQTIRAAMANPVKSLRTE